MLLAGPASAPASAAGPIPGATCPAGAIPVRPGMSLQSAINAAPAGASFCIGAGEHRLQAAIPKDGQRFHGEPGALLNGSRLVTEFSREGRYWVAEGQVQRGEQRPEVICLPGREMLLSRGLLPRRRGAGACLAPAGCGAGPLLFDYRNNRVYFRDDPRGRKVEAAVAPYAFRGGARDVLVENLTIEKYAPPVQYGAVGYNRPSPGWIVRNNEIRLNYGLGVSVGSNTQVLENHIHGNGEMGAGCVGRDILFERNEIAFNGYFSGVEPNWEGGGGKCALTQRLVVRGNHL
ncbi:hypothetical protein ACFQU7_31525, partial [Pseudoroseomonas wenyumeiae]